MGVSKNNGTPKTPQNDHLERPPLEFQALHRRDLAFVVFERYWSSNRCTMGDACNFAHSDTELREQPDLVPWLVGLDRREGLLKDPGFATWVFLGFHREVQLCSKGFS